jgi:DNA-binding CsgD family transcriptional regulator
MLAEMPERRWRAWDPSLPPPRAFAAQVQRRLQACTPPTRHLVEAVAVLGTTAPLGSVSVLADVDDVMSALDEASTVGLLQVRDEIGIREVGFPHPLVQAAVYEQLGARRRVELHRAAARVVEDEGALLRHRVLATTPPDPDLAAELDGFARREAAVGAWAGAVWALVEGSNLSADRRQHEERLLRAVDASVGAGDLIQAEAFARDVASFGPGPWRDAALGYLAVLRGRPGEAEHLLRSAWRRSETAGDPAVAAVVAQRLALHGVGRLRGDEVVEWSRRAVALAATSDEPVRIEAEALLGLGLGWQGHLADGIAAYDAVLGRVSVADDGPQLDRVRMAHGWLQLVGDDVVGARGSLAHTAPAALAAGSVRIAVWSFVWLAQAGFAVGAWDEAALEAARAISLLDESGHEWLRPLARYAAAQVCAARGEWAAAGEHAAAASSQSGDYELMVVAAALAKAQVPLARADHEAVLRTLEPMVAITSPGVDEPGFWPWQDAYADALISAGRLDDADVFLAPHERRAEARQRRSMIARLARVRGRLETARSNSDAAEVAFARAVAEIERLPMPFQRAQVELAHGQALRRGGRRRAAAARLQAARDRFAELRAAPYLERCERELRACGLAPAKRGDFDFTQLTAQERAVARLVASGMSNRQVAAELFVSVKTVQFHLTHVYTKLGIGSRAELAARFRD